LPVQAASPAPEVLEHVEAPAPEPGADSWDEPLLAAEVFPAFFPKMPWQIPVLPPAMIGDAQQGSDDGLPVSSGNPTGFRPGPLECRSTALPPDAPPDTPPNPPACPALDLPRDTPPGFPLESPPWTPPTTPIPEPGSLALVLGALGVAVAVRRRRDAGGGLSAKAATRPPTQV
jgi:hypothetical protein